jgi:uncharacterized protein with PCYCGC motif
MWRAGLERCRIEFSDQREEQAMRRGFLTILAGALLLGTSAHGRELSELEGIVYSTDIPPYAIEVAPNAEIPPPLRGDQFTDPDVQELYRAAFLLRRLLIQLPCFCACHERAGHKSLYACYVAAVGSACYSAECEVCLDEARIAKSMAEKGASVEDIRAALRARFGDAEGHGN